MHGCHRLNINPVVKMYVLTSCTCVNCLLARGSTKARFSPEFTVTDRSNCFKTELTTCSYIGLGEIMKCTTTKWAGGRLCASVYVSRNVGRLRLYNARPGKVRPLNRRLSKRHLFLDTSSTTTWSSACLFFSSPSWPPFCSSSVRKQRSNDQID